MKKLTPFQKALAAFNWIYKRDWLFSIVLTGFILSFYRAARFLFGSVVDEIVIFIMYVLVAISMTFYIGLIFLKRKK